MANVYTSLRKLRPISPSLAHLVAWGLLAIIDMSFVLVKLPLPREGWRLRGPHILFDVGQLLTCGLVSMLVVELWRRFVHVKWWWSVAALAAFATSIGAMVLKDDIYLRAGKVATAAGIPFVVSLYAFIFLGANSVTLASMAGRILSRGILRWAAVLVGLLVAIGNYYLLHNDYPGIHLYLGWSAATLIAVAISDTRDVAAALSAKKWAVMVGACALASLSWVIPPSSLVAQQIYRLSGSFLPPFVARLHSVDSVPVLVRRGQWFRKRDNLPDIPASKPSLVPPNPIVLILVGDALRADVFVSGKYDALLPNIAELRDTSTNFINARSTAPATIQSVTSIFAGRYYSQMYWHTFKKGGQKGAVYCHDDHSVRFPELLIKKAGADSVTFAGLDDLMNITRITYRFTEETFVPGRGFAGAALMMPPAIRRIQKQGNRPMFMYLHFNDPHAPYTRGGTSGTPFERYVREVAVIDRELGRLRKALARTGLAKRTVIVLTSDHGEAFGEHREHYHAVSVYDVLLHVPLLIHVPGKRHGRVVKTPVSLIDLAPTTLDLMGVPTPGTYMGQSLVPFLRGESPRLSRPIVADSARLQRAMVFPDGIKIIEDRRKNTVELYDIIRDPGELHNLVGERPEELKERLQTLHAFFAVHELRRPGYKTPFSR